jgi:hypothetical protein
MVERSHQPQFSHDMPSVNCASMYVLNSAMLQPKARDHSARPAVGLERGMIKVRGELRKKRTNPGATKEPGGSSFVESLPAAEWW